MDSPGDRQRKDRLIQTRVPQNLESTLKDEAKKRRLSVSHLIRNVLEDTFNLVDNVVTGVDRVVADSVDLAQTIKRDARRIANARSDAYGDQASEDTVQEAARPVAEPPRPTRESNLDALSHVFGFQELVLNREASCASCGVPLARGSKAFLGMSDQPAPRVWVCQECVDALSQR